ncbi:CdaR family protein [Niallia nealsonii]|uniref:YbbR-like domain-containing protein n=1 Tax=Niallia nealsonii TaxID=115979 RepID=A0A2N0Z0W2_9BACI|nr:CdaR family protein [Niallia nealsonii]PKG23150.1 hypothetical protein CWS01_13360 [Niallia nealsonii]
MNKFFDRIVENNWFMKIIAFALALLLFISVYDKNEDSSDVNVPGNDATEVVKDIPVKVYYDTKNVVVAGVPKTVDVTLKGPKSHVQVAKQSKDFEVYVNLANADIGEKKVKLQIKDLSDKLEADIDPSTVKVTVKEKVTKEFNVEAEFSNNSIASGYAAGSAELDSNTVKITGAKDEIDKIAYVKANVEVDGSTTETIEQEAEISVLDSSLNKLDVQVEPETVKVTIPVKRVSKKVPINIVKKGSLPQNVTLESITLDKEEATITGSDSVLKDVDSTRVEVDLSKITKDQTLSLPVIISNGVKTVDPELVNATVKVNVKEEETKEQESEKSADNDSSNTEETDQSEDDEISDTTDETSDTTDETSDTTDETTDETSDTTDNTTDKSTDDATTDDNEAEEATSSEQTSAKTLESVPISIRGLDTNFLGDMTSPSNGSTDIEVTAKESILKNVTKSNFTLYIDVSDLGEGEHEVDIKANGPNDVEWSLANKVATIAITKKDS